MCLVSSLTFSKWTTPARPPSSTRSWHDSTSTSPVSRKPGWPTVDQLWKEITTSSGKACPRTSRGSIYGVDFAVRNSLIATTETPSGGSSRILALRMKTSAGLVNIIPAYAPTLISTPEAKEQLYEALQETLSGIPSSEGIFQRSRWYRLASMAYLPRPLRRRQDEWEWAEVARTLLSPRPLHQEQLL